MKLCCLHLLCANQRWNFRMQHSVDQLYPRKTGGRARQAGKQTRFVSSVISLSQRCKSGVMWYSREVQQKAAYSVFDVPTFTTPYEVGLLLSLVCFQSCHTPLGPLASILGPSLRYQQLWWTQLENSCNWWACVFTPISICSHKKNQPTENETAKTANLFDYIAHCLLSFYYWWMLL